MSKQKNNFKIDFRHILFSVFGMALVGTLGFLLFQNMNNTDAADMGGFWAGNIMSDEVMSDYSSMSEGEIQNFLKAHNPCNDSDWNKYVEWTNKGYQYHWENGHFVCMADENFNGESAAHIIWQAAQDYRVSPKVLIVLLQKEQGLVTDTWPNSNFQYRSATGFGCPDTDECDVKYYGFKNQVRNSAGLFREVLDGGWSNYPAYQNNYVQYNPNAGCGGTTIYIENRATSALYRYTPYQPNGAALATDYGTGDACSAYGNRNFYSYYTDWFGDIHIPSGFQGLEKPRFFQVAETGNRINPFTGAVIDTLTAGQEIKFSSKINTSSGWCFRTEHNTINNILACFPQDKLKEVTLRFEDIPEGEQIRAVLPHSHKTYIRGKSAYQNINTQIIRTFVKKVTLAGTTYYVTKFDDEYNNGEYGVHEQYITNAPAVKYESFTVPREMELKHNTPQVKPITTEEYGEGTKYQIYKFTSKIYINNQWYYRTEENTNQGIDLAFPASEVMEFTTRYEDFMVPREMKLTRDAGRINPITQEVFDALSKGSVIKFASKTYLNNQWYYRTAHNTSEGIDLVVPASAVTDL